MNRNGWSDIVRWLLLYSLLWYLLSGGTGWELGIPSVILATGIAVHLRLQPMRTRLLQLPRFIIFFLRAASSGAWDVARRTVHPHYSLQPSWVVYELKSSTPASVGLLCSAMVGLLPGTLASRLDKRQMHLHVLDERQPWRESVAELEQQLCRLLIPRGQT